MGIKQTDLRTFCKTEAESLIHLFWSCDVTSHFWQEFKQWITTNHENVTSNFSPAIVLGLNHFSLARKLVISAYLLAITFGSAEVKRSLLDLRIS